LLLCLMPLGNVLQGCGSCCPDCTIAQDSFTRADNTDISANIVAPDTVSSWTESSGAWAIVSNKLNCTTAGIVICNDAHPDAVSTMTVTVDASHDTTSRQLHVIVALVNSTNYIYARYNIGGATSFIWIKKVVAGVETLLSASGNFTMTAGVTYALKVCVKQNGVIAASIDGVPKTSTSTPGVTLGTQCGLGSEGSGIATFDNFVMVKTLHTVTAPACVACDTLIVPAVGCRNCCALGGTETLTLYWPGGLTDQSCTRCSGLTAGDYVLTRSSAGSCSWSYITSGCDATCTDGRLVSSGDSTVCTRYWLAADLFVDGGECYFRIRVQLYSITAIFGNQYLLASANYMTAVSLDTFDGCDGTTRDLEIVLTPATPYRGRTDWLTEEKVGCNGSWPTTPTIRLT